MGTVKKIVSAGFTGVIGLIFTLAGLQLITLTSELLLYMGATLLLLAVFFFFKA